ncbi:MAG: hypothetical protein ACO3JL_13535, partial [Myxococcota bacterium]
VETLERALAIAARHELPELRIAAGTQSELPDTVEHIVLRGGWVREGGEWSEGAEHSVLQLGAGGGLLRDVEASMLTISLSAADSLLTLAETVSLVDVLVTEQPTHLGTLVAVADDAIATLVRVEVRASSPAVEEVAAMTVGRGADLRLQDGEIHGATGGQWVGLDCDAAAVDLEGTTIVGGADAEQVTGLRAEDCRIDVARSTLAGGGDSFFATGIDIKETALVVDEESRVVGLTAGHALEATALRLVAADASALLRGEWISAINSVSTVAVGLDIESNRTEVRSVTVTASGEESASGMILRSSDFEGVNARLAVASASGDATGIDLIEAHDASLRGLSLNVEGTTAFGIRAAAPGVENVRLEASTIGVILREGGAGIGLGASRGVTLRDLDVAVESSGEAITARGIGLQDGTLERLKVTVIGGGDLFGVVLASGDSATMLERVALRVESDSGSALGVLGASRAVLRSTLVAARGTPGNGVDARQATSLQHVSVLATEAAILAGSSMAALSMSNTVLVAEIGLSQGAAAPTPMLLAGVAFASASPWVNQTGTVAMTQTALSARGCLDCLIIADALLDDAGRQLPVSPHPLRDKGLVTYAVAFDVDGEPSPVGEGPDIGADEYLPE